MKTRKGFTIIELMLAMSFVAVLMVTVAFLVIRITAIYQKGLTTRSVNQVGRNIITELNRAVADSPVDDSLRDRNQYFYRVLDSENRQMYGAFCTGRYSFLWNTGTAINKGEVNRLLFQNLSQSLPYNFRLLRFDDSRRTVCEALEILDSNDMRDKVVDFRNIIARLGGTRTACSPAYANDTRYDPHIAGFALQCSAPTELLTLTATDRAADTTTASESDLAFYDFRVFPPTTNRVTGHAFYSATFILGTLRGIDINASGNYCVNMSETLNTDFAYCSINKFNFAMSTTGTSGVGDGYGQRDLTTEEEL